MKFNTIPELIDEIRNGRMVLLIDDEDRENEGDLVLAADFVTPEKVNFMACEARGLICLSLSPEQIDRLQLPMMVRDELNLSPHKTAFTVSIEAASGVSTGISASDRARTITVASRPDAKPSDLHTPGHIFPIRAQHGGVLKRAGHTEGSVDLAKLAGLNPAAVICEVMNEDGTMARVPELIEFARKHKIKIGTIVDLIEFRLRNETLIEQVAVAPLQELGDDYQIRVFRSRVDGAEHLVLQKGEVSAEGPTLVRVHSDSLVRDLIGSLRYSGSSLYKALSMIEEEGNGVLLFLRPSGHRSLAEEVEAINKLRDADEDVIDKALSMDAREYGIGAQILRELGIHKIRLISNRPGKRVGLKAYGLEIVDAVPFSEGAESSAPAISQQLTSGVTEIENRNSRRSVQ